MMQQSCENICRNTDDNLDMRCRAPW